jgi:hypothetical protein
MFDGCTNLQNITFPPGSALTSIQAHGLEGMDKLTSIDFGDAKVTNIDNFAFRFCESLSTLSLPETITNIGRYAFYGCKSLTSVTIYSNAVVNSNNSIKDIFGEQVTEYIIGSGVTSIGSYAFSGCSSLTTVTIPNSVSSLRDCAFTGCSSLASLTIPKNVITIGNGVFFGCNSLKTVNYTGTKKQWKAIKKAKKITASTNKQYVLCTNGKVKL